MSNATDTITDTITDERLAEIIEAVPAVDIIADYQEFTGAQAAFRRFIARKSGYTTMPREILLDCARFIQMGRVGNDGICTLEEMVTIIAELKAAQVAA